MKNRVEVSNRHSTPSALTIAAVAALPVVNFVLFGTFNLYAGNPTEFDSGFRDILPLYAPAMAIAWLSLFALGMVFQGRFRSRYACLLFGFGLLIWAQGVFFAGSYGVLDGRGLDWHAMAWPAWLDIVLWLAVLAGSVACFRYLLPLLLPGSLALILLQLVAAGHTGITSEERLWSGNRIVATGPPAEIFQYSSRSNVVHLVLDNFQTDVFEELVREEGLEDALDGFVLFRETAAVTPYTSLAMPSIFKGRVYDGSMPSSTFFHRGADRGFHNRLHDQGYRVHLSPMQPMRQSRHDFMYEVPGVFGATADEIHAREAIELIDITLFRHVPHLARNWVYNGNNWRIRPIAADPEALPRSFHHKRYFRHYTRNLEVAGDEPAYHFMHLWPPHPPFFTTADGKFAGKALPNTRENYKHEARAILLLFVEFLQQLKQLGIYDQTLIVLHSDHGGSFEPEFTPPRMLALLAVKQRNSRGPMQNSNAQVSLTDIAATILGEEGLEIDWPGRSVFDVEEDEERQRRFVFYHGDHNQYLKPVLIEGSLYSADSYVHLDSVELNMDRKTYTWGETVNVALDGTGSMYLGQGWSTPEPRMIWNNGHEASLVIPVEPPHGDVQLTLWLTPSIHEDVLPRQRVRLYVGDQRIARWELDRRGGFRLETVIPAEMINTDELVIRFELPDAASQVDLGVGGDQRHLAVALARFQLTPL